MRGQTNEPRPKSDCTQYELEKKGEVKVYGTSPPQVIRRPNPLDFITCTWKNQIHESPVDAGYMDLPSCTLSTSDSYSRFLSFLVPSHVFSFLHSFALLSPPSLRPSLSLPLRQLLESLRKWSLLSWGLFTEGRSWWFGYQVPRFLSVAFSFLSSFRATCFSIKFSLDSICDCFRVLLFSNIYLSVSLCSFPS